MPEKPFEGRFYYIETFGCQQNERDSEIIAGILEDLGFLPSDVSSADIIIFNTCAVRETAEEKIKGKIGALKALRYKNKNLVIGIGGCMTAVRETAEEIYKTFPFVSFVFGTGALEKLPRLIKDAFNGRRTPFGDESSEIPEELPSVRRDPYRADVSVMYGCDNFCTYCIVPYTRGRERSRLPDEILKEVSAAVKGGAKEITLLGQNVNSYGKGLPEKISFPELLSAVASLDGDFRVRFMTSHPKDASDALFEAMAANPKICRHLHLPVQSGSDRVLKAMNRRYTAAHYISLIKKARALIPDLVVTSDIIVGFPGETEEDFEETLDLLREIRFDSLFTFIYSVRRGTRAATMEGKIDEKTAHDRFDRLVALQNAVSRAENEALVGKTLRLLVTGKSETDPAVLAARSEGNRLCHLKADPSLIGKFVNAEIISAKTWSLEASVRP